MAAQIFIAILFIVWIWAICYALSHKHSFPTVTAGTLKYEYSPGFTTKFGGVFRPDKKVSNYKFHHNDLMFVRAANDVECKWKTGDFLVINTADLVYDKGAMYLFQQGQTYRIVTCTANAGGLPPIFDGHETLISHTNLGRVIGWMIDGGKSMKIFIEDNPVKP